MPAPIGNKNAAKGRLWLAAIERALATRSRTQGRDALDKLAEQLLTLCDGGDLGALKELGDRLDGKPQQSLSLGDDPENPISAVLALIGGFAHRLSGGTVEHTARPLVDDLGPDRESLGIDTSDPITLPD